MTTSSSPIEITIKVDARALMPFLITLFTILRDDDGRPPASPFPRGFRVSGPFSLEDLLEIVDRKTGEGDGEGDTEGEPLDRVFEELQKLRRRAGRPPSPSGEGTPPASPEGPQGFVPGFDPGDDPFEGNDTLGGDAKGGD